MGKTTNKQMPGFMITKVRDLTPQEREALSPEDRELLEAIEAHDMKRFLEALEIIADSSEDLESALESIDDLLEVLDPVQVRKDIEEAGAEVVNMDDDELIELLNLLGIGQPGGPLS